MSISAFTTTLWGLSVVILVFLPDHYCMGAARASYAHSEEVPNVHTNSELPLGVALEEPQGDSIHHEVFHVPELRFYPQTLVCMLLCSACEHWLRPRSAHRELCTTLSPAAD